MNYDVIIVGAGPAGSTAAITLAQKNYNVLLLDRQDFPRPKTCGDGIPPSSMQVLYDLGMTAEVEQANFYPIHGIKFRLPGGRIINTRFQSKQPGVDFFIAPRDQFDFMLQQKAIQSGATFQVANVNSPIMTGNKISGVNATVGKEQIKFTAPVVIGAPPVPLVVPAPEPVAGPLPTPVVPPAPVVATPAPLPVSSPSSVSASVEPTAQAASKEAEARAMSEWRVFMKDSRVAFSMHTVCR